MLKNPIYDSTALDVATELNYAAQGDAYDGTPIKRTPLLAAIQQGLRPKKQLPAQWRNWLDNQFAQLFQALIGDAGGIQGELRLLGVQNFGAPVVEVNAIYSALAWEPVNGRWLVGKYINDGINNLDYFVRDFGRADGSMGGGSALSANATKFVSCIVSGSNDVDTLSTLRNSVFVEQAKQSQDASGQVAKIYAYDPTTDAYTLNTTLSNYVFTDGVLFNGHFILIGPEQTSGTTTGPAIATSSNSVSGTFTAIASLRDGSRYNNAQAWCCAAGSSAAVFMPRSQSGSGSFRFVRTTDGTNFTLHDAPDGGFQGVCWDDEAGQFVAVRCGDGTNVPSISDETTIYTSTDGLTWNPNDVSVGVALTDIACLGGGVYSAIDLNGNMWATTNGGEEWRKIGYQLETTVTASGVTPSTLQTAWQRPRVRTNGNRLVASTCGSFAYGLNAGLL